ncbi:MAG: cyclic pyranopterin monophosphate synthase MoaC [Dehalococcoidia bacterium]|nr:cyclic pyranopterin monophosphate synthase MoaC [Dehalococcoidia bacterium]
MLEWRKGIPPLPPNKTVRRNGVTPYIISIVNIADSVTTSPRRTEALLSAIIKSAVYLNLPLRRFGDGRGWNQRFSLMVEIYTDGACLGNPGPGGWAAIILDEDGEAEDPISGFEEHTTNNRMEIMAALKGLESISLGGEVTLYTDSQYLFNTMTKGWKRRINLDLWDALDKAASTRRVHWRWVRGHNGNRMNEEADKLASEMARMALTGSYSADTPDYRKDTVDDSAANTNTKNTLVLSHIDSETGRAMMVDVSAKDDTERVATAKGSVVMNPETLALIKNGAMAKGDVLSVAQIAGIMGAKQTSHLIPMCHPLMLTNVKVELELDEERSAVSIEATVKTTGKTGVEMEALTAVAVAALTIYDMCKAVDRGMRIQEVRMTYKTGGKSGEIALD